ncbi:MAG TPA: SDR family oxidoreductase [Chloroflexota bacterium]|nr:SDR family oxidoreductase [Chloroflexota bacterium]
MIAIVTGAGSGIGRATALRLASDGFAVAVADLNLAAAEETARAIDGTPIDVDVADTAAVRRMVESVEQRLGPVDLLVNNAGWDRIGPFMESDEALWDRLLAVNLKGPIACSHAVLPGMIERRQGRIICVGSDAGRVGSSGEVVYSATKGGVIAFAKALAREVARYGILVNCVAPGPTDTPFLQGFGGNERILEAMTKATPLRRLAQPAEIAAAISFLASPDAAFITGQTLSINGGLTML